MKHSEFLHSLSKNWFLIFLVIVLDVFFFYSFGKVYVGEFQELSVHMTQLNAVLGSNMAQLAQTENPNDLNVDVVRVEAIAKQIYAGIARVFGFLLVFWLAFQGSAWFFCTRIAEHKLKPGDFFVRFVAVSVLGFVGFLIIFAGTLYLAYTSYSTPLPLIGHDGVVIIAIAAVFVLLYGVVVGYAVPLKRWWKTVKNYKIALTYLVLVIVFVLLQASMLWLAKLSVLYGLAFALLMVLPLLVLSRVYFIKTCEN